MFTKDSFRALIDAREAMLGPSVRSYLWANGDGLLTSGHELARLAIEFHEAVACLDTLRAPNYCGGRGYVQVMSDVYEDCRGCFGCRDGYHVREGVNAHTRWVKGDPRLNAAWGMSIGLWRLAYRAEHAAIDRSLAGFRGLWAIGAAVTAALSVGKSIGEAVAAIRPRLATVEIGRWYRVVGERGKAKGSLGVVGECVWRGRHDRPSRYGSFSHHGAERCGLKPLDGAETIFVACSQVEPCDAPERAVVGRKLEKAARARRTAERYEGSRGDTAHVITGEHAGKSGRVVWCGTTRNGAHRVGIQTNPKAPMKGRSHDATVIWCDTRDVRDQAIQVGDEGHIWADVAMRAIDWLRELAAMVEVPTPAPVMVAISTPVKAKRTRTKRTAPVAMAA